MEGHTLNLHQQVASYPSMAAAARAMGVAKSTLHGRLARERRALPRVNVMGEKADMIAEAVRAIRPHAAPPPPPRGAQSRHRQWYEANNRVLHDDGRLLELERLPETVLHWSCSQAPYHHPDTLPFLAMVKAQWNPDLVVCHGDEADLQFLKKAFMSADSLGPVAELEQTQEFLGQVARIFPQMLLLTSNHIHTRQRYAQAQGNIPTLMLREWRDVIAAPADWSWFDYVIARDHLWEHGHDIDKGSRGGIVEQTIKRFGRPLSVTRGHIHSEHGLHIKPVWYTPTRQIWIAYVSCLMDGAKVGYTRAPTVNGAAITYRGHHIPVPMPKDKHNRFTGRLVEW